MSGFFSPRYVRAPPLDALTQHMPDNVKSARVNVVGVQELYVVPLFDVQMAITDEIATATKQLLFPDNNDAFEAATEAMGITISDAGTQRYSISGSRQFFHTVCPVLVKTDGCIVCCCQHGRMYGECGHENYVRYIQLN